MPSTTPGSSTSQTLPGELSITEARKGRRRALADGRPEPVVIPSTEPECLRDLSSGRIAFYV